MHRLTQREIQRPDWLSPDVLVALKKLIATHRARNARGPAETGKRDTPSPLLPQGDEFCRRHKEPAGTTWLPETESYVKRSPGATKLNPSGTPRAVVR